VVLGQSWGMFSKGNLLVKRIADWAGT
jgi:hypothetical protein